MSKGLQVLGTGKNSRCKRDRVQNGSVLTKCDCNEIFHDIIFTTDEIIFYQNYRLSVMVDVLLGKKINHRLDEITTSDGEPY